MTRMQLSLAILVALLGLASGCVVLPTTKTTVKNAGTETSPLSYGVVTGVKVQTGSSHTDVRVRATADRVCQRTIYAVREITKSKHAKLGVDDPRGRALGLLFAPVTLPVSAIITGFVLLGADDETTRQSTPVKTETLACTSAADDLALELQFPSGHIYRGKTDDNGVLVAAIPSDEPYVGSVSVKGQTIDTQIHYEQVVPPVTATRDAALTCLTEHKLAGVTLKLTIDEHGKVARMAASAGDGNFSACISKRLATTVFPASLRNATVVLPFEAPTS